MLRGVGEGVSPSLTVLFVYNSVETNTEVLLSFWRVDLLPSTTRLGDGHDDRRFGNCGNVPPEVSRIMNRGDYRLTIHYG